MSADERLERISQKEQEILQDLHIYGQYYEARKMERVCLRNDENARLKKKIDVIFSVAKRWDMSIELAEEAYNLLNEEKK